MSGHQHIYMCLCRGEGLTLSRWEDDKEICISMFSYGNNAAASPGSGWGYRLRHIWQIITKGHPFLDSVILDYPSARELGEELIKAGSQ